MVARLADVLFHIDSSLIYIGLYIFTVQFESLSGLSHFEEMHLDVDCLAGGVR